MNGTQILSFPKLWVFFLNVFAARQVMKRYKITLGQRGTAGTVVNWVLQILNTDSSLTFKNCSVEVAKMINACVL